MKGVKITLLPGLTGIIEDIGGKIRRVRLRGGLSVSFFAFISYFFLLAVDFTMVRIFIRILA